MAEETLGKILSGKYRLLSVLGQGAMGVVYRAEQLDVTGLPLREVALKTVRSEFSLDPNFSRQFLHEVRVVARLHSAHAVTLYDCGQDEEGQLYYSMELVRGQTLREVLQSQSPLPVGRVLRITGQVCEALAEAHSLPNPIVHRDLKPANIFIEERQREDWVKVGDFGIAKALGEQTSWLTAGAILGTPRYMAPEQWLGQAVDGRTDLYALGIILYEMLVGETPFTAKEGQLALMHQHLQQSPPPLPAKLPAGVRRQVERLLAKTLQERPPDALSVRRALEAVIAGKDDQGTFSLKEKESLSRAKTEILGDQTNQSAGREQKDQARAVPKPPEAVHPQPGEPPVKTKQRRTAPWAYVMVGGLLGLGLLIRAPWGYYWQQVERVLWQVQEEQKPVIVGTQQQEEEVPQEASAKRKVSLPTPGETETKPETVPPETPPPPPPFQG